MIGTESKEPEITRGEASVGSEASMVESALFRRSFASAVVVPKAKEILITERPVVEVAVVVSRFSRPITALSMI